MNRAAFFCLATMATGAAAFQPSPDVRVLELRAGSYLGIGVHEIDAARAKALGLREERGVEVTRVAEDSPASRAGLKTGDVVLEYHGQRVEGVEQFMRMVRETPAGREVRILVSRSGANQQITLTTASRKLEMKELEVGSMPRFSFPDISMPRMSWHSAFLGIDTEALDSQLAEYFGVKEGVLVRSVARGSAAERAGLKAGDVITGIDDSKTGSPREITSALRAARSRKPVTVHVTREKRDMTLQMQVDD